MKQHVVEPLHYDYVEKRLIQCYFITYSLALFCVSKQKIVLTEPIHARDRLVS